jgi:hypothetical protein
VAGGASNDRPSGSLARTVVRGGAERTAGVDRSAESLTQGS